MLIRGSSTISNSSTSCHGELLQGHLRLKRARDSGEPLEQIRDVLLADDDAALRIGLRVQLERWGYEPTVCEDDTAARAVLFGAHPPSLAILDGDEWQQLETYLSEHSEAEFSHGVCPTCLETARKELGLQP